MRTMHAAYVLIFLLIMAVLGLGAYEALAAATNPDASIVRPLFVRAPGPAVLSAPAQVYSPTMDFRRVAQAGERYHVIKWEAGWVLAVRDGDPLEEMVWIELTAGAQLTEGASPIEEAAALAPRFLGGMLLALVAVYGTRRLLRLWRSRRSARSGARYGRSRDGMDAATERVRAASSHLGVDSAPASAGPDGDGPSVEPGRVGPRRLG